MTGPLSPCDNPLCACHDVLRRTRRPDVPDPDDYADPQSDVRRGP